MQFSSPLPPVELAHSSTVRRSSSNRSTSSSSCPSSLTAPSLVSSLSSSSSSCPSSASFRQTSKRTTLSWTLICSFIILNSLTTLLSPSTHGGLVNAALSPGFCGDCQTFATAISVCGGSFKPADIEINGEYVLQQQYSKCTCSDVMQKLLWTCAKCEFLNGHQSKGPPPQKYQTQCMAWGMTIEEWRAPYTGVVAPGTQTDVTNGGGGGGGGGGGTKPSQPSLPSPSQSTGPTKPTNNPTTPTGGNGGGGGGGGSDGGDQTKSTSDVVLPSASSDKSVTDDVTNTPGTKSLAIGIAGGIIGVAVMAGTIAVVMMKRRRRRRTPLDLDSLPGQTAHFMTSNEDKWDKSNSSQYPGSPPMAPAPVASAPPIVGRFDNQGYVDSATVVGSSVAGGSSVVGSSVVGGYDGQYDGYDHQYRGNNNGYDAYGRQYGNGGYMDQRQYRGRYDQGYRQVDHGQQEMYPANDYGYDPKGPAGNSGNGQYI